MSDTESSAGSASDEEEQQNSAAEEENEFDLAASDTGSDEMESGEDEDDDDEEDDDDDDDDDDEDSDDVDDEAKNSNHEQKPKSREVTILENVFKRCEAIRGKQLYIRFPYRLPSDEKKFNEKIKALSPLITKINKPRQKSSFCTVDFPTQEVRDAAMQEIKEKVQSDPNFERVVVATPNVEKEDFVKNMVSNKLKTIERRKAKARLKRASNQALKSKNFTSSVVVTNLPKSSTVAEVRGIFPTAIDVEIKPRKDKLNNTSVATITLASTIDAREAVKKKVVLGGTQLKIAFYRKRGKSGKQKSNNPKKLGLAKSKSKNSEKSEKTTQEEEKKAVKRKPPGAEKKVQKKLAKKVKN